MSGLLEVRGAHRGIAYRGWLGAAGQRSVAAHRGGRIGQWEDHAIPGADGIASTRGAGQRRSVAAESSRSSLARGGA